jgi:Fic family protein
MRVFDTLHYVKRLQEAGVAREHAEAHAAVMSEMILIEVATKSDVEQAASGLRQEIEQAASSLRQEIALVRNEQAAMRTEIDQIKVQMATRQDLALLRSELERRIDQVTMRLGALLVVGIGALAALQRLA